MPEGAFFEEAFIGTQLHVLGEGQNLFEEVRINAKCGRGRRIEIGVLYFGLYPSNVALAAQQYGAGVHLHGYLLQYVKLTLRHYAHRVNMVLHLFGQRMYVALKLKK